ncbi:UBA/TS-N domain containing protein [Trichomonas vaginalis G3]|uniref:Poly [ADP-ribose] polymerase n=1 Tax=Trichomonas vaginalis (strain ATCC PRA-98 / G3) TaxID=412133 RepID=A2EK30_TRIV3|nr:poly ADP-ribose polymerase family, member PARP family [Trichomonas vaginalis G3]EAY07014.1 UBA/TS-N domain containing protein [Trichomonas vaginalis G3]KAI5488806.1 poly ADP-ribose polymerase family, member PARP family [Trichomonas vaginalis G3]|eukprot:XP_001319237.1 UBA/TS-N domain containing protein [Trichomonas vaginalis G3]
MSDEDDGFYDNDDGDNDADDGEVVLDEESQSQSIIIKETNDSYSLKFHSLTNVINIYNAFIVNNPAYVDNTGRITFSILADCLPLSSQVVYGFNKSEKLLEVNLILTNMSWQQKPDFISVLHPEYQNNYIGRPLISQVINDFFSSDYSPRDFYQAASHILSPPGRCEPAKLKKLRDMGFDGERASHALALFRNDFDQALSFLRTGIAPAIETDIHISYKDCPLLYFVLELVEVFLDLPDHCCVCRKQLQEPGVKPTPCDNPLCQFTFTELGVGCGVYNEILRDPDAADLVISMFAAATKDKWLIPAPPDFSVDECKQIVRTLPSMNTIITTYKNDAEIINAIGERPMRLLRWILLTNRSQFMSLNGSLELAELKGGTAKMFLALSSTPQKEQRFRELQQQYGSLFLWHGSPSSRWHAIFRNGLKNMSNTDGMLNGAAHGNGIYFARDSSTSIGYSSHCDVSANTYINSRFKIMTIVALCEIAKVPALKDHGWCHTLMQEEACIVRFLMLNLSRSIDIINQQPQNIPTLRDVLEYHANHAFQ